MAAFTVSQDGNLTMLFAGKSDLEQTIENLRDGLGELLEKHQGCSDDETIICVLAIPNLPEAYGYEN